MEVGVCPLSPATYNGCDVAFHSFNSFAKLVQRIS